jgi:hypothetical protein
MREGRRHYFWALSSLVASVSCWQSVKDSGQCTLANENELLPVKPLKVVMSSTHCDQRQ